MGKFLSISAVDHHQLDLAHDTAAASLGCDHYAGNKKKVSNSDDKIQGHDHYASAIIMQVNTVN